MSENYKPEISVVRHNAMHRGVWNNEDGLYPAEPRALFVRGVPMVGERVVSVYGSRGKVVGYDVRARVDYGGAGEAMPYNPTDLAPAPTEDEADVERVARAMFEADHPDGGWDASGWDGRIDRETYLARAEVAIKTMEKKP